MRRPSIGYFSASAASRARRASRRPSSTRDVRPPPAWSGAGGARPRPSRGASSPLNTRRTGGSSDDLGFPGLDRQVEEPAVHAARRRSLRAQSPPDRAARPSEARHAAQRHGTSAGARKRGMETSRSPRSTACRAACDRGPRRVKSSACGPCSTIRPRVENEDAVGAAHRREAVRDHERRPARASGWRGRAR